MPGIVTMKKKDGTPCQCVVKWTPDEVNQMSPPQLIEMLTEMKATAHYWTSTFYDPIYNLKEKCNQLEERKDSTGLLQYGAAFVGCLIIWAIMKATKHHFLAALLIFAVIGALVLTLFHAIRFAAACATYARQYPAAAAELERLQQAEDVFVTQTGTYELRSGIAILPNYYLDEYALNAMIGYLRNQRVFTLSQAINLFEQEKQLSLQTSALNAQLASQLRTEANTRSAAAAAASAATNSGIAATNSIYNRK